jgi:hypothetical protein
MPNNWTERGGEVKEADRNFVRDDVIMALIRSDGPVTLEAIRYEVGIQYGLVPTWRIAQLMNELLHHKAVALYDDCASFIAI